MGLRVKECFAKVIFVRSKPRTMLLMCLLILALTHTSFQMKKRIRYNANCHKALL